MGNNAALGDRKSPAERRSISPRGECRGPVVRKAGRSPARRPLQRSCSSAESPIASLEALLDEEFDVFDGDVLGQLGVRLVDDE